MAWQWLDPWQQLSTTVLLQGYNEPLELIQISNDKVVILELREQHEECVVALEDRQNKHLAAAR